MKDPVETFPSEILSPLFALFNSKELAILSAVCRSWRIQIQTDIIINRILDLTGLGRDLSQDQTIQLVKRLASLSSYPKNEIYLELQPFCDSFQARFKTESDADPTYQEIMQATGNKFGLLLRAIASATKGNLSELHLLGPWYRRKQLTNSLAAAIIEGVFTLDKTMERLELVSIGLPLPVSLESTTGSRAVRLLQTGEPQSLWNLNSLLNLIKQVTQFTGSGLRRLEFSFNQFDDVRSHRQVLREIFEEVDKSSSTLKKLDLNLDSIEQSQLSLITIAKCNNLSFLDLCFRANTVAQQVFFPSTTSVSSLRELTVFMYGLTLCWTPSLTNWIGSNLRSLRIIQQGSSLKVPLEFVKDVFNNNSMLEEVDFAGFRISPSFGSTSSKGIYLPRLKRLGLSSLDHLNELFSGALLPSLRKLKLFPPAAEGQGGESSVPNLSDQFLPMLQLCKSSIKELSISDMYLESFELPGQIDSNLELDQVETLDMFRSSANLVKLFSQFTFSQLKNLKLDRIVMSIDDVVRFLIGSCTTLESVDLGGVKRKRKRKAKDVASLKDCSFPKLKILKLRKGSSHMLDFFSQASFANLEDLEVDFVESLEISSTDNENLEQASFYSFINLMRSGCRTLVKATFNGLAQDEKGSPIGLAVLHPTSFRSLEDLDVSLHNNDPSFLDFFGKCDFPFLCSLRISVALPEPKYTFFEGVCKKIASTSPFMGNLTRIESNGHAIIYSEDIEW